MAMSKTSPMLPPPKQTSIARRKLLVLPSGKKKQKTVLIIAVVQRWPVVDKTLPANHVHPRLATKIECNSRLQIFLRPPKIPKQHRRNCSVK
jgi:hypothetical protein